MQVAKWGNSLAVRLPAALVRQLGLKEGDEVAITATTDRDLSLSRSRDPETILADLRQFRGRMPADFKFDREEANARGE